MSSHFHFAISGDLEDFRAFAAILRGEDDKLRGMSDKLNDATRDLKKEIEQNFPGSITESNNVGEDMPNPVLSDLNASVNEATTVMQSAQTLIDGIASRIQAAVDAAIANGASAAELEPVVAEVNALRAASTGLAASVQANTPAA